MGKHSKYKFWDNLASRYDKLISKYAQKTYDRSIELMREELGADQNVLEIGTGTGLIAFAIGDMVKSIRGIDYAPKMIELANEKLSKTNFSNIEFKINSATQIEYGDKSFDVIIASNVFHLLPEPYVVLTEIERLLVDNGKAILPTYCHGENLKARIISFLTSLSGFKVENRWSVNQFSTFIEHHGFKIVKQEIIKDKFPLSFIVITKKNHHG
jgi:ubiquinone/menaquinone biosynthesis C-methylase UbiE